MVYRNKKSLLSCTMASNKKISLKLLVDKHQSRVVMAESDKDFVDILLSFLTMPMGTIAKLVGKDSSLGCIANLYKGVEGLDSRHFQTEACKAMLLDPLNAAGLHCENLAVNVDDKISPRTLFTCPESDCCAKATCYYSSVPNVRCSCGKEMSYAGTWGKENMNAAGDGVFVRGGIEFIVSDELHITQASTAVILSLFSKKGIKDGSILEERIMDIGHDEILKLLERSLTSSSPLTDLCFDNSMPSNGKVPSGDGIFQLVPKCEEDGNSDSEELKVKLLLTKTNRKMVYMECDEEVLNFLFSFLTFPLGAIIKLLNKSSSMGCADNLYESAEVLSAQENLCIKSEESKTMLLGPKLPPFCGVKRQLLKIEESVSHGGSTNAGCYSCERTGSSCCHRVKTTEFKELNPKSPNNVTESGGGYAKGPCKFMVTDDLDVALVSPFSTVRIINEFGGSISNLVEEEVSIGKTQALNILKAALCSEKALTKVLLSQKYRHAA